MFTHLKELSGLIEVRSPGFFQEDTKGYTDSGQFTDEFYKIKDQINGIMKIIKHPRWLQYLKTTDENFDAYTEAAAKGAIMAVTELEDALIEIDHEFNRLNNPSASDATAADDLEIDEPPPPPEK